MSDATSGKPRTYRFPPLMRAGLFGAMPTSQVVVLAVGCSLSFVGILLRLFPWALVPALLAAMVAFNRPNAKTHSGVWRDLWVRRRRTEIDVQIAPIAEIGASHGIDCPAVRRLVAMTHECEAGVRPMSDANLTELMSP